VKEFGSVEPGLIGVTGDKALDAAEGGLMGDRLVGEATDKDDRLRDREEEERWRC
jgi:hypothetical protein